MGSAYSSLVFLPPQPSYTATAPWLRFVPGTAAKGQKVPVMLFTRGEPGLMEHGLGDRTLLYCHGNAEDIGEGAQLYAEISASLGCNVVVYDYAGYGLNSLESPSEAACYADVEAVATWVLEELRVSPENLFVLGKSLGSGSAVHCVKTLEKGGLAVGGLIVQSGISSAVSVVSKRTARMLPFADMFQNYKKLPSIQAKTLVVHGDMDEVVPYENGVTNANACKNLTEFVTLECGHNDMELLHLEKMLDLYRAFIHGS